MNTAPKRICLISVEIFAWGKYGGFGKAMRIIGRELVRRGYDVYAVVPRQKGQQEEELLDGIKVISFLPSDVLSSGSIYKKIKADIYHSCQASMGTWLAMKAMPDAVHLVTARDPKDLSDWVTEFSNPSKSRIQVVKNILYENNFLVHQAVRKAKAVFVPAAFLKDKVKRVYNLKSEVYFLPTPTEIPDVVVKSERPTVLYMGRIDKRKRPELTLELAKEFPEVVFKIAGKSREPEYETMLREKYRANTNVEFLGFINQFEGSMHHQLLSEAWIHINTAAREGLPNSFIEAAGHHCAILSFVNPEEFASKFGYHAGRNDFQKGLEWLLANDHWIEKGRSGYEYVKATYGLEAAMDEHEKAYLKYFTLHKRGS
jgi:glycosyltransferase involved in cell wall biosynthesis